MGYRTLNNSSNFKFTTNEYTRSNHAQSKEIPAFWDVMER